MHITHVYMQQAINQRLWRSVRRVTTSVDDVALAVDRPARCVSDVGDWMSLSRLRLNSSKTQAIWLG